MGTVAPRKPGDQQALLTRSQAASRLEISERKLSDMVAANTVPHVKIGRSLRFQQDSLDAWVETLERGGRSNA
jgi:excisionase family DNA binding protein